MTNTFNPRYFNVSKAHLVRNHCGDDTSIKSTITITADEDAEDNKINAVAENEDLTVSFNATIESAIHLDGDQDEYIHGLFTELAKIKFKRDLTHAPISYHEVKMLNMLTNQLQRVVVDTINAYRQKIRGVEDK